MKSELSAEKNTPYMPESFFCCCYHIAFYFGQQAIKSFSATHWASR